MPRFPASPLAGALALGCALLLPPGLRADDPRPPKPRAGPAGFELELPSPLQPGACPTGAQLRLQAAAEAVRAAWGPVRSLQTAKVAGVELTDDPRVLAHLGRILGAAPPADWAAKARRCTNALCALSVTLGGSLEGALWMLSIGASAGPVASLDQAPFKGGPESIWRADELRTVARTLAALPASLRAQARDLAALRRIPDGQDPFHGANAFSTRADAKGPGAIFLRDTVWKMPLRGQREILTHELGHHLEYAQGRGYPISHSREWLAFSGWRLVGADPEAKDAYRIDPRAEVTSTASPIPSEEFPDAVADYRYNPRLLKAYSEARYQYVKKLYGGEEYLTPPADPALDAAFAKAGGLLALYQRQCAALVQRASRVVGQPQALLFLVRQRKGGGTEWASWYRSFFVTRSPCAGDVLEALQATPQWKELSCAQDEEEFGLRVAARLESAAAAYAEAAQAMQRAVPSGTAPGCLQRGEVTVDCFDGAQGRQVAEQEARRILAELAPQQPATPEAIGGLRRQLEAQAVLAPSDDELLQRFPLLGSPQDLLAACLGGVIEVSTPVNGGDWRWWVRNPPENQIRGFASPLWSNACARDFAAYMRGRGVALDPADTLFEHLLFLARNQAGPLADRLFDGVPKGWPALKAECGVAANTKPTAEQQPCAAKWLEQRLAGLVPPLAAPPLARQLAGQLRGN